VAEIPFHSWGARQAEDALPNPLPDPGSVIVQASAGNAHSLFLTSTGRVYSCGFNDYGQLGREDVPPDGYAGNLGVIPGLGDVALVSAGNTFSLFVLANGEAWSCGSNDYGQLGRAAAPGEDSATNLGKIPGLSGIVSAAAGGVGGNWNSHSLFVASDGTAWSCGLNDSGQLGRAVESGTEDEPNLAAVPGLPFVTAAAAGETHSLFLASDGRVFSCGGDIPALGRGEDDSDLEGDDGTVNLGLAATGATAVAAGQNVSMIRLANGQIHSCGENTWYQLGRATGEVYQSYFGLCGSGASMAAGRQFSGLVTGGKGYTFGRNSYGQLGRAAPDGYYDTPNTGYTLGGGLTGMAAGQYHALFWNSSGNAYSCGAQCLGRPGVTAPGNPQESTNLGVVVF
jgi:alpha-tubulin suppressor-like RCC1 family protein